MDGSTLNKVGYESMFIHPPFQKVGLSFFKGGRKGGKGGPSLKGGCRFVKNTLDDKIANLPEHVLRYRSVMVKIQLLQLFRHPNARKSF